MAAGLIVIIVIGALIVLALCAMFPELRRYFHIRKM